MFGEGAPFGRVEEARCAAFEGFDYYGAPECEVYGPVDAGEVGLWAPESHQLPGAAGVADPGVFFGAGEHFIEAV